ncbi:MAG TPA: hypothetical protein PKM71_00820 [Candidatus Cloacimonas sp.]|nr:hypothetical protein [Candidatus Cloacimonas sp.]
MKNFQKTMNKLMGNVQCNITNIAFQGDNGTIESDIKAINAQQPEGAIKLTAEDVFIFEAELSNSNIDYYYTRMTIESLQNYADKINRQGIPLMVHHIEELFPMGRIFKGDVIRDDSGVNRLKIRSYIVRGDSNEIISGDVVIRKIETGVQKDMSIGFIAGGYTCSICGGAMVPGWFSRAVGVECEHVIGATYDGQTAYAWVEDGDVIEGTLCYTGATPEAIIDKALNLFKSGKLSSAQVNSLNKNLRANIKIEQNNKGEEKEMKAKEILKNFLAVEGISDTVKNSIGEEVEKLQDEDGAEKALEVLGNAVKTLEAENIAKEERAKIGDQYKADLIESTLAEGVRAMGKGFDKETMQNFFESATIDVIKAHKAQYNTIVEKLFGKKNNEVDKDTTDTDPDKANEGAEGDEGKEDKEGEKIVPAEEYK